MWYKCLNKDCGFIFYRVEECVQCPDCGEEILREATPEETNMQSLENDELPAYSNKE